MQRAARARRHVRVLPRSRPTTTARDLGVLFWHKDGFSTACGHGTIALGAWAVDAGRVAAAADGSDRRRRSTCPSGRVTRACACAGGAGRGGRLRQRARRRARPRRAGDHVARRGAVDVAYGGAIYASVAAADRRPRRRPRELPETSSRSAARSSDALDGTAHARHPSDDRLTGVYGTICVRRPRRHRGRAAPAQRHRLRRRRGRPLAVRLGHLRAGSRCSHADGRLAPGDGPARTTRSSARPSPAGCATSAGRRRRTAVLPRSRGTAYRTGEHRFVLDPDDPLGHRVRAAVRVLPRRGRRRGAAAARRRSTRSRRALRGRARPRRRPAARPSAEAGEMLLMPSAVAGRRRRQARDGRAREPGRAACPGSRASTLLFDPATLAPGRAARRHRR